MTYGIGEEFIYNPSSYAVVQYDQYNMCYPDGNRDRISTATPGLQYRF